MRRVPIFIAVVLALSCTAFAQTGFRLKTRSVAELNADQRRVIGTWCRQDFEGLRLYASGWDRFKPVTSLKKNPDITSIVIVSRYQVESHETVSWDTDVTYTIVGRYEVGGGFVPDSGTETVAFQTKDIDGDILIVNVEPIAPHVSKKAAIEWMKKTLEASTSDMEKIHLRDALKALEPPPPVTTETSK